MGGGGGGTFYRRTPEDLIRLVRQVEDQTSVAQFEAQLSDYLNGLLGAYNGRDTDLVRERLDEVKRALEGQIEGTVDQLFGGSVAKHTYVDGLSDIDSLLLLNGTGLEERSPQVALETIREALTDRVRNVASIEQGRMAVTITFADGMVLQLLPAIRTDGERLRVPSSRRDGWSHIDPAAFREALTRRNEECANKLVPTIKLAKAVIAQLPEAQRLTGYHVESLAIAAFRGYEGLKTTSAMLPTFFERARELVLGPIHDSTGQSVHVDEYLGPPSSDARVALSHVLNRLAKRMRTASASGSEAQWKALFGSEDE